MEHENGIQVVTQGTVHDELTWETRNAFEICLKILHECILVLDNLMKLAQLHSNEWEDDSDR